MDESVPVTIEVAGLPQVARLAAAAAAFLDAWDAGAQDHARREGTAGQVADGRARLLDRRQTYGQVLELHAALAGVASLRPEPTPATLAEHFSQPEVIAEMAEAELERRRLGGLEPDALVAEARTRYLHDADFHARVERAVQVFEATAGPIGELSRGAARQSTAVALLLAEAGA